MSEPVTKEFRIALLEKYNQATQAYRDDIEGMHTVIEYMAEEHPELDPEIGYIVKELAFATHCLEEALLWLDGSVVGDE